MSAADALLKQQQERVRQFQTRLLRPLVPPPTLVEACSVLQPGHLADIALERAISRLCGYPLCGQQLEARGQGSGLSRVVPSQGFTRTDVAQGRKLGEPTEAHRQANFCCAKCWKASVFLMAQMLDPTVLTRGSDGKPIPVELLWLPEDAAAEKAKAAASPATSAASAASRDIQARLDELSHGEVSKLAQQLQTSITIKEKPGAGSGAEPGAPASSFSRLEEGTGAYVSSVEGHESKRGAAGGASGSGTSRFAQQRQRAAAASHRRTTEELDEANSSAGGTPSGPAAPRPLAPAPVPAHLAGELIDVGQRYREQKAAAAAAASRRAAGSSSSNNGHRRFLGNVRLASSSLDDPTLGRRDLPQGLQHEIRELSKQEATQETLAAYAKLVAVAMQGVADKGGSGGATPSPDAAEAGQAGVHASAAASDSDSDHEATIARLAAKLPFMGRKKRQEELAARHKASAATAKARVVEGPAVVAQQAAPAMAPLAAAVPLAAPVPVAPVVAAAPVAAATTERKGVRWAADVVGSGAEGPRKPAARQGSEWYGSDDDYDEEEDELDDYYGVDPEVYDSLWSNLEGGSDTDDSYYDGEGGVTTAVQRRRRGGDDYDEEEDEEAPGVKPPAGGSATSSEGIERGRIVAVLAGDSATDDVPDDDVTGGDVQLVDGRPSPAASSAPAQDGTLLAAAAARADGTTEGVLPVFAPLRRFGMAGISVVSVAWDCLVSWHTPETAAVLAGQVATEAGLAELVKANAGPASKPAAPAPAPGGAAAGAASELSPEVAAGIARGDYLLTALRKVVPAVRELYLKASTMQGGEEAPSPLQRQTAADAAAVAAALAPPAAAFHDRLELVVKSFSLHEPVPVMPQSLWLLLGGIVVAGVAGVCCGVASPLSPILAPLMAAVSEALAAASKSKPAAGTGSTPGPAAGSPEEGLEGVIPRAPDAQELLWLLATLVEGAEARLPAAPSAKPQSQPSSGGGTAAAASASAQQQLAALAAAKRRGQPATKGSLFTPGGDVADAELALLQAMRREAGLGPGRGRG